MVTANDQFIKDEVTRLKAERDRLNKADATEFARLERLAQTGETDAARRSAQSKAESLRDTRRARNERFNVRINTISDLRMNDRARGLTQSQILAMARTKEDKFFTPSGQNPIVKLSKQEIVGIEMAGARKEAMEAFPSTRTNFRLPAERKFSSSISEVSAPALAPQKEEFIGVSSSTNLTGNDYVRFLPQAIFPPPLFNFFRASRDKVSNFFKADRPEVPDTTVPNFFTRPGSTTVVSEDGKITFLPPNIDFIPKPTPPTSKPSIPPGSVFSSSGSGGTGGTATFTVTQPPPVYQTPITPQTPAPVISQRLETLKPTLQQARERKALESEFKGSALGEITTKANQPQSGVSIAPFTPFGIPSQFTFKVPIETFSFSNLKRSFTTPLTTPAGDRITFRQGVRAFSRFAADTEIRGLTTFTPLGKPLISERYLKPIIDFRAGVIEGTIPKTKGELAFTGLSFGLGAAIGGSVRGIGTAGRAFLPKAAPFIETGISTGLTIGTGIFAYSEGKAIINQPTAQTRGLRFGQFNREILALGKGAQVGERVTGRVIGLRRTVGLKELPTKGEGALVDPGFFKGEKFPTVKTSAGKFLESFKEPRLPGETTGVFRGFSARTKPLQGKTELGKKRPREIQGTFIAPDISPFFFRAGAGERGFLPKLISFAEFGKLPVAERLSVPKGISLISEVSPRARNPISISQRRADELTQALKGTGQGVVTFSSKVNRGKVEAEAVIGAESPVSKATKNFFIKDPISGERIPILERTVTGNKKFIDPGGKRVKDLSTEFTRPRSFTEGFVTAGTGGTRRGRTSRRIDFRIPERAPRRPEPRTTRRTPRRPERPALRPPTRPPTRRTTRRPGTPRTPPRAPPRRPPRRPDRGNFRRFPVPPIIPGIGGPQARKGRVKRKRTFARRPSLAALALNIKAPKPVRGERSGLVIRPLIQKRRKRRKKK